MERSETQVREAVLTVPREALAKLNPPTGAVVVHLRRNDAFDGSVSPRGGATVVFTVCPSPKGAHLTEVTFGVSICHPDETFERRVGIGIATTRYQAFMNSCVEVRPALRSYSVLEIEFAASSLRHSETSGYYLPASGYLRRKIAEDCLSVFMDALSASALDADDDEDFIPLLGEGSDDLNAVLDAMEAQGIDSFDDPRLPPEVREKLEESQKPFNDWDDAVNTLAVTDPKDIH